MREAALVELRTKLDPELESNAAWASELLNRALELHVYACYRKRGPRTSRTPTSAVPAVPRISLCQTAPGSYVRALFHGGLYQGGAVDTKASQQLPSGAIFLRCENAFVATIHEGKRLSAVTLKERAF